MLTSFFHYQLKNKTSGKVQTGALLKLKENDFFGVADICPHPELGDMTLTEELTKQGPLYKHAYQLALEDLFARKNRKSLLNDKAIKNNWLIINLQQDDLLQGKFSNSTIKIKGGVDVLQLAELLNSSPNKLKFRIDFNAKLTNDEFELFLSLLSVSAMSKIEYIEDPTLVNENWMRWNKIVPLAADFQKAEENISYKIFKPSREKVLPLKYKYTLTSAMEHPVGLAHGLRVAQNLAQNDSGFSTLDLYEDVGFNKYFHSDGCWLNFSSEALNDFGIGMTEELNKLAWCERD